MKEAKPDALFEAGLSLPYRQRNSLDAEMLEIFDVCNESKRQLLPYCLFRQPLFYRFDGLRSQRQ
jgi:hypothetical protein